MEVYKILPPVLKTLVCGYDPDKKKNYDLMLNELTRVLKYTAENKLKIMCYKLENILSYHDYRNCLRLDDNDWQDYVRCSILLDHHISRYGIECVGLQYISNCVETMNKLNMKINNVV